MASVELVGRLLVSLAVVLGLIWMVARRARGGKRAVARAGKLIDVLGRQQLSRSASVAVVRVHDRAMVLGITDGSVQLLSEMELDAVQAALTPRSTAGAGGGTGAGAGATATASSAAGTVTTTSAAGTASSTVATTTATGSVIDRDLETVGAATRSGGALAGSALSPTTWKQTIEALREMTVRKG